MIASQDATDDRLTLSRAVSGHGVQEVALTASPEGVVLRVSSRLDSRHGDGWSEAVLGPDDVAALRAWLDQR